MTLTCVLDTHPRRIVRAIVHSSDVAGPDLHVRPAGRVWVGAWPWEVGAVRVVRSASPRA